MAVTDLDGEAALGVAVEATVTLGRGGKQVASKVVLKPSRKDAGVFELDLLKHSAALGPYKCAPHLKKVFDLNAASSSQGKLVCTSS